MPTGKYRNQCKKCKNARRKNANASEAAKKARSDRRDTTPLPSACVQCGKGPSEVEFRWRDDVKKGGWRETCTACYNAKKYHATYRDKKNQEDPETFRAHNTAVHLAWVLQNPDRMREYQELQRTDPERKFKALLTYVRAKNRKNGTVIDKDGGDEGEEEEEGEEDVDDENSDDDYEFSVGMSSDSRAALARVPLRVCMNDADTLKARFSMPCHYCCHTPAPGGVLNCLDRIDTSGHYDASNTVAACCACNKMRGCMAVDELIDNVRRIYQHRHIADGEGPSEPMRRLTFGGTVERRSAAKKEKRDLLTLDEKIELWSSPCYLCNRLPALGIDRVNSSDDYTASSCRPCCSTYCNYMKCDWDLADFLGHIRRVYLHTEQWVIRDVGDFPITGHSKQERTSVACSSRFLSGSERSEIMIAFPGIGPACKIMGVNKGALQDAIVKRTRVNRMTWERITRSEFERMTRRNPTDGTSLVRSVLSSALNQ
jgi:hypothetical protein